MLNKILVVFQTEEKTNKNKRKFHKPTSFLDLETGEIISKHSYSVAGGRYSNFGERMLQKRRMFDALRVEVQDFLTLLLRERRKDPFGRVDMGSIRRLHAEKTGTRYDNTLRLVQKLQEVGILDKLNNPHTVFIEPLDCTED